MTGIDNDLPTPLDITYVSVDQARRRLQDRTPEQLATDVRAAKVRMAMMNSRNSDYALMDLLFDEAMAGRRAKQALEDLLRNW